MRLYYVPRTRASRPRWVLEELGVPYELVRLDPTRGETRTAEHLRRHPLGHVPVLEDDGEAFFESAAVCLYLADRFPDRGLAPPAGTPARGRLYQWIFYAMTEIEPALAVLSAERKKPEPERGAEVMAAAEARVAHAAAPLEALLQRGPWILGSAFSVADVVCGAVLLWARSLRALPELPAVEDWLKRLRERPAWRRAHAE